MGVWPKHFKRHLLPLSLSLSLSLSHSLVSTHSLSVTKGAEPQPELWGKIRSWLREGWQSCHLGGEAARQSSDTTEQSIIFLASINAWRPGGAPHLTCTSTSKNIFLCISLIVNYLDFYLFIHALLFEFPLNEVSLKNRGTYSGSCTNLF